LWYNNFDSCDNSIIV